MGKKEDYKINVLRDREPMELPENWGDVVTVAGVGERVSSRVLYLFIEDFG